MLPELPLLLLLPLLIAPAICLPHTVPIEIKARVNTNQYLHESQDQFLSIALDCTLVGTNWKTFDPTDPGVIAMAKGLGPAILRLGGTSCDWVIFNDTSLANASIPPTNPELGWKETSILKIHDWDRLVQFARVANFTLLFDANVMLRDKVNHWNPQNFEMFLKYNQEQNNSHLMFELGNEPNNYPAHFNKTITPTQLADDFATLQRTLDKYAMYKDSVIVGADVGNPYLRKGLQLDPATYIYGFFKAAHSTINALTWHQYYLKGATATVADFINSTVLDTFPQQVAIVNSIVHSVLGPNASFPLWMGETSSAYNSGAANISNRYVAGFLWMDKLGVAAQSGYDIVIRQTFYDGWYSLIDHQLQPLPDYWLSLLYKRLVGKRSLAVDITEGKGSARVYASCARVRDGVKAGAVTLYAMNLDHTSAVVISTGLNSSTVLAYNLEPTDGTLTSPHVNINGKMMSLVDKALPDIPPRWTSAVILKPLTFGFFVLNDANAKACL